MLKHIFYSVALISLLTVIGCNNENISEPITNPGNVKLNILIDQNKFKSMDEARLQGKGVSDPFEIKKVERKADSLYITVSYSGGCKEHSFDIVWNGSILQTYPLQANLLLKHYANEDPCYQKITEILKINIKKLFGDHYSDEVSFIVFNVFSMLNSTHYPDGPGPPIYNP